LLIIFDLDDTLIDTSGCITPVKLGQALHKVEEAGWQFASYSKALQELLECNELAASAEKALQDFFSAKKIPDRFLQIAKDEVYKTLADGIDIVPMEGAFTLLQNLKKQHELAIVSVGNQHQQLFKLKKAGIDTAFFYKIYTISEGSKKEYYRMLQKKLGVPFSSIIVCGDRIEGDLLPAKELGCIAVHMKWGRGKRGNGLVHGIDFTITKLSQMEEVIEKITSNV
jgi:putative hydrolase of the HAD superfamily